MKALLDTSTVSLAMRGQRGVRERLQRELRDQLAISAITVAEGLYGCECSDNPTRWRPAWLHVAATWTVLPFDQACAEYYARIRADLARRGTPIGDRDTMIAATAAAHNLVVVTADVADFRRVRGLRVEDWAQPKPGKR